MATRKVLEQHIAVFGESGSGKTVMLSSFFGSMKQPASTADRTFDLVADNPAQGTQLLQKYYAMRDDGALPPSNRFRSDSYSFSLKLRRPPSSSGGSRAPFHAVKMVWHDYPGEWFEQDVSGPAEEQRRIELFRTLLVSDVAMLLVDGQKLKDHAGEEERYFGSLFGSLSNMFLAMKDDLLDGEDHLVQFPRIWVLGLSKADVLPEMTVTRFSEIVTKSAGHHLNELREVISGFIEADEALSVGEDLMLLSSAKFEPGQIDLSQRVGVDLILPLTAMLPFERHMRWAGMKEVPARVARNLVADSANILKVLGWASFLLKKVKLPGPIGAIAAGVAVALNPAITKQISNMTLSKLDELHANAAQRKDDLAMTLTQFAIDLKTAEEDEILIRSPR